MVMVVLPAMLVLTDRKPSMQLKLKRMPDDPNEPEDRWEPWLRRPKQVLLVAGLATFVLIPAMLAAGALIYGPLWTGIWRTRGNRFALLAGGSAHKLFRVGALLGRQTFQPGQCVVRVEVTFLHELWHLFFGRVFAAGFNHRWCHWGFLLGRWRLVSEPLRQRLMFEKYASESVLVVAATATTFSTLWHAG